MVTVSLATNTRKLEPKSSPTAMANRRRYPSFRVDCPKEMKPRLGMKAVDNEDSESSIDSSSSSSSSSTSSRIRSRSNRSQRADRGGMLATGMLVLTAGAVCFLLESINLSETHRAFEHHASVRRLLHVPLSKTILPTAPAVIRERPDGLNYTSQFAAPTLVPNDICGGCREQKISSARITCGFWMTKEMAKRKISIKESGQRAASRFPSCARCDPKACEHMEKQYWSPDEAAPRVLAARSLRLNFPARYRIPKAALGDLEGYFDQKKNQHPYLFEWNPSIIVLPQDQIPDRLLHLQGSDAPVYLAIFRVTKQQNCFANHETFVKHVGTLNSEFYKDFVDLAGIAFLREDYSIIEEGLFDLRKAIHRSQDLRLAVFPPEEGSTESRIYVSAFQQVTRLWLRPPVDSKSKRVYYDYFQRSENPFYVILEEHAACCTSCNGKNFHYFLDDSGTIMVETLPMNPHTVEEIDLNKDCDSSSMNKKYQDTAIEQKFTPKPSFHNTDTTYFLDNGVYELPYSKEHGTTCCIRMKHPQNSDKELLVGISHSKTMLDDKIRSETVTEQRQYLSRFYAFEPVYPYRIVAVSGGFCMPFPTESEAKENYNVKLLQQRPFLLGKSLQCPYITFISGMTVKATDKDRVVMTYGLNDCTARVVEVPMEDISNMLFDPVARNRTLIF